MKEPVRACIQGIVGAHKTKFLELLGGEVHEGEEYEESMNKYPF